jgi:hypothetical protein
MSSIIRSVDKLPLAGAEPTETLSAKCGANPPGIGDVHNIVIQNIAPITEAEFAREQEGRKFHASRCCARSTPAVAIALDFLE